MRQVFYNPHSKDLAQFEDDFDDEIQVEEDDEAIRGFNHHQRMETLESPEKLPGANKKKKKRNKKKKQG